MRRRIFAFDFNRLISKKKKEKCIEVTMEINAIRNFSRILLDLIRLESYK